MGVLIGLLSVIAFVAASTLIAVRRAKRNGDGTGAIRNYDAKREGFRVYVRNYWYSGSWYLHASAEHDAGRYTGDTISGCPTPNPIQSSSIDDEERRPGSIMFNPNKCGLMRNWAADPEADLYEGLIPAAQIGDKVGLYKVSKRYSKPGSDRLGWDDGMAVDLDLVRIITRQELDDYYVAKAQQEVGV